MFALGCWLVIAKPAIRPTASIIIKIQPLVSMSSFVCGDVLMIGLLFYYCFFIKEDWLFDEIYGVT